MTWQTIESAPKFERVWVCGWQPRYNTCRGYWWWHEDAVSEGKAIEHPDALFWCKIVLPAFPAPPEGSE